LVLLLLNFWIVLKGDRFGGALDGAAKQFSEGYDAGMIPMEFVNTMRKKGQLIMGIGHRVKSVSLQCAF
jgi:ATP citrate (pro-S)-lyase